MKKRSNTLFIVEVAVFTALAYLLDFFANVLSFKIWPEGGSVSIAMVPIFIMAYRWGIKGGVLTGFLMGLLQFIMGYSQIFTIVQGIIDYFIAFAAVGFAGIFASQVKKAVHEHKGRKWITYAVLGAFIGSALRFVCHFISGVVFFGSYAPKGQPVAVYSILYNGTYMLPSFILSAIIVVLVISAAPRKMV
jgi:thiamine transporter